MKKLPLTIIILTNRSDSRFVAALESAQVAHEVLIVDHQSQNNWSELSRKYDFIISKKLHSAKIENFAKIRNQAMQTASFDWVFFLDSDEIIEKTEYRHLEQCISQNRISGFFVQRRDIYLGKQLQHGETGHMQLLRLFLKEQTHFSGVVHEVALVDGKTAKSKITLVHHSHPSLAEFFSSIQEYSVLASQQPTPQLLFWLQFFIFPPAKFIYTYIILGGFRDGMRGFCYSLMMSLHSFFVRVHTYEKYYR